MNFSSPVVFELDRGLRFNFHRSKTSFPSNFAELNLSDSKFISESSDLNSFLVSRQAKYASGVSKAVPVFWNNGGSWLRLAKIAVESGITDIHIYQQEPKNELLTNYRVLMKPKESPICFIPNYKCGYSSMWRFLRRNFESCAIKGRHTFSLNSFEPILGGDYEFAFSFVRDPVKRLQSFYIDKFCREAGHHNVKDYLEVYQALLGEFDPEMLIDFVGSIPSDFADRHWKSFYDNLHFNGLPLFDAVYDIYSEEVFLSDISRLLANDLEMPRANNTDRYDVARVREYFASDSAEKLIKERFYKDYVFFRAVSLDGFIKLKG